MKATVLIILLAIVVAFPLSAQTVAVFDTVFYSDTHGSRIATMYVPSESNGVGVVLGHWWTGARSTMRCWAESLAAHGYIAMAFDYYDFNYRSSICKYPKPVTTFKLAVEFLRRGGQHFGVRTGKIVGLGQSEGSIHWGQSIVWDNDDAFFGTDPAIDDRLDAAVLLYGAYDTEHYILNTSFDMNTVWIPYFSANPDLRYTKGNTIANVANITTPVIIFHSTGDQVIRHEHSVALHDSLTAQGKVSELHTGVWEGPAGGHPYDVQRPGPAVFTGQGLITKDIVLAFLKEHVLSPWVSQSSGTTEKLLGVSFTDVNTGTVVGYNGTILRTTDGGETWDSMSSGITGGLWDVSFTDISTGTVVGEGGTILRTTDGGATWVGQSSGTMALLYGVSFSDANTGMVVGGGGTILRTTDGGGTWVGQSSGTTKSLRDVSFTDANTGTAVGADGIILRTTDGGATWASQASGTAEHLWAVCFTDANTGTAVGSGGTILRTTKGGLTWDSLSSGTTTDLWDVSFTDANTGAVVAGRGFGGDHGGEILRTTDGGETWVRNQLSEGTPGLHSVCFTDANTGVAVGSGGTILRKVIGVVTSVEEDPRVDGEVPITFALQQNYPNPFNPSTTIEFALPHAGYVTLKVYNILGEEVAALIAGERAAGRFSAMWDASRLPSGMYFYRLVAGDYVQTKKAVLVR